MYSHHVRWSAPDRLLPLVVPLLFVLATACGGDDKQAEAPTAAPSSARPQVFEVPTAPASPTSIAEAPTPEGPRFPAPSDDAQLVRMVIPAAKVNAPFSIKGVNTRNEMETPNGKDDVAWYNFTGRPGFGSNAIFSGHVDWYSGEIGVFWYLRDLKQGDEITVRLSDNTELKYKVSSNDLYKVENAPVAEIVGPTTNDIVTLITCEGVFNPGSGEYSDRRVVRAERIA